MKEVAEMLVFVLLGVTIFEEGLKYDVYLIAMTCIGCVLARGVATFALSFLLNVRRPESDKISLKSQIVVWNAGLRGAVAYALAVSSTMPKTNPENTNLMITTVHASVIFTIFFHGLLTVPIVSFTGLAGTGVDSRQLSEPRPARKKIHSIWSRLDKQYIIPFISFARPSPSNLDSNHADSQPDDIGRKSDMLGIELDERDSSIDVPRPAVYSDYEDNPNDLDHSLFQHHHHDNSSSSDDVRQAGHFAIVDPAASSPSVSLRRSVPENSEVDHDGSNLI